MLFFETVKVQGRNSSISNTDAKQLQICKYVTTQKRFQNSRVRKIEIKIAKDVIFWTGTIQQDYWLCVLCQKCIFCRCLFCKCIFCTFAKYTQLRHLLGFASFHILSVLSFKKVSPLYFADTLR